MQAFDDSFYSQHNVIYSLCQLPREPTTLRVTVRDPTGKFTWDMKLVYEHAKQVTKALDTKRAAKPKKPAAAAAPAAAPGGKLSKMLQGAPPAPKRGAGLPPIYSANDGVSTSADQLDDLID